jgi:hypothetical protein
MIVPAYGSLEYHIQRALDQSKIATPQRFLVLTYDHDVWGDARPSYYWADSLYALKAVLIEWVAESSIQKVWDLHQKKELEWSVKSVTIEDERSIGFGERMGDWSDWGMTMWDKAGNVSPGWRYATREEAIAAAPNYMRTIDPFDVVVFAFTVVNPREGQQVGETWYGIEYGKEKKHTGLGSANITEEVLRIPYDYRLTQPFKMYREKIEEERAKIPTGGHHGPHCRFVWLWRSQWEKPENEHVASYDDYERVVEEARDMLERGNIISFVVDTATWTELELKVDLALMPRSEKK